MRIYLDHNAGAPLRSAARTSMTQFMAAGGEGNPASVHFSGQRTRRLLEQARAQVVEAIDASPGSVVFTSGGTESNNLAIFGAATACAGRRRIITSAIEHSSVLAPIAELERRGFEVVRMDVDRDGRISSAPELIDGNTALVTLGLVNAEVGTIQDLRAMGEATRRNGATFHIDAVQAFGRMRLAVTDYRCDLMTLSGHKVGGPGGIGALYIRPGYELAPRIYGGPQEAGLRAGTPNLIGAVGFAAAVGEAAACMDEERRRIGSLARELLRHLERTIPGLSLNGPRDGRLENTLNLAFPEVLGESMLIALDLEGIEISMGSACAAGAVEPSHVLIAMGRTAAEARTSVRISLGWSTLPEEIERAAEIIPRIWQRVAAAEPLQASP